MTEIVLLWLVIAVLVAINGLFVAAEFAIVGVRPSRLAQRAAEGDALAAALSRTARDPARLSRYFSTTQLGITAATLGLGMYAEHRLSEQLLPLLERIGPLSVAAAHTLATVVAVGLLTYLHVVVGEMIPKTVALRFPERTAFGLAPVMAFSRTAMAPAVLTLSSLGALALRLLGVRPPGEHARSLSSEELALAIGESVGRGFFRERESRILMSIFAFGDRTAQQVMTPRTRIEAVPSDITEDALAVILAEGPHTRLPVYDGTLDRITGILHLKEYVRARQADDAFDLSALVRPALFVPESLPIAGLLKRFRSDRAHMAIVLDEYGGTAGLVTFEDLIEEVVGEVLDEFDVELPPIARRGPGRLDVAGEVQLDDLARIVPWPADLPNVQTIGGLALACLGSAPAVGDSVELDGGVRLTVRGVAGRSVTRVGIRHPAKGAAPDAAG